jgi:uncharacterized protein YqgQ
LDKVCASLCDGAFAAAQHSDRARCDKLMERFEAELKASFRKRARLSQQDIGKLSQMELIDLQAELLRACATITRELKKTKKKKKKPKLESERRRIIRDAATSQALFAADKSTFAQGTYRRCL